MKPNNQQANEKWNKLRAEYFSDRPVIIAANRAPITFDYTPDGELTFTRGAGGLVTALNGLATYMPARWIACARTEADARWEEGEVEVNENQKVYVKFINPSPETYDGYYNHIANPLLWFIQHNMWDLPRAPIINKHTWHAWKNGYQEVNRMYAEAITRFTCNADNRPVVMLQDYHLYLAGRYLRKQLRRQQMPTLMHFTHIPWPGPDYWQILPPPMRHEILDGMCSIDVLGFQTRDDGRNFIRTVSALLPKSSVNYKDRTIWYRNHRTHVRDFPISIDVPGLNNTAASPEVKEYLEDIKRIKGNHTLIVRVDRIDPSKNIQRGFQAFEEMLEIYPEHLGKVKFLAILIPSRLDVPEYQNYLDELMAAVGQVNARFGDSDWEPIRLIVSENYPKAIAALQSYDVLLVNSIADGMNLVAKEGPIVNQCSGVLILSERTGARQQLETGALVISPCDIYETAEAVHRAITMDPEEKKERAAELRRLVETEDITHWLLDQLESIVELHL
ncbi:MAG: trehalose-6-phosphate synthase [Anaerolineales bacterium]|nr:trehalose-6-phosphate synthase [Anaerolineales bacterium]